MSSSTYSEVPFQRLPPTHKLVRHLVLVRYTSRLLLLTCILLGEKSNNYSTAPPQQVNIDQSMVVDSEFTGKKMCKTTCSGSSFLTRFALHPYILPHH